jgi:hypothetical protein
VKPDKQALKGELRRIAMARFDVEAALATCGPLKARGSFEGSDWGPAAWGLWTGVIDSYMRPFTNATLSLKDPQWQTFDDPDLQAVHDRLKELRDKVFSHNDATGWRKVIVFPPDTPGRAGTLATEEQPTFNVAAISPIEDLCRFQIARLNERIVDIGAILFEERTFSPFTMLEVEEI